MTNEQLDKAWEDQTWLVGTRYGLVRVTHPRIGDVIRVSRTSIARSKWEMCKDLRLATAKDMLELGE